VTAPARLTQADIDRPFTVPALAERWDCSEGLVRKMIERGELSSFRLGVLIRIPASEVAKIECQSLTASNDSGADTLSSGKSRATGEDENSMPKIARAQKPRRAGFGKPVTIPRGRLDA
tara:strand:+ start:89 stop:445 length:357 start_codon:yes stop_codon:yes gene_type:complete